MQSKENFLVTPSHRLRRRRLTPRLKRSIWELSFSLNSFSACAVEELNSRKRNYTNYLYTDTHSAQTHRHTDTQAHRHTDTQTHRHTVHRHTQTHTGTQKHRHHTHIHTHIFWNTLISKVNWNILGLLLDFRLKNVKKNSQNQVCSGCV